MNTYLREVKFTDAELIANWCNDKENIKYMSTLVRCKVHSKENIEKEINNIDPNYERLFMICLKCKENEKGKEGEESKEFPIGHAGIDDLDFDDLRGEIFLMIGEKGEHSKGYGLETVKLLLNYGFNKLGLNSIFATVAVENKPSLRLLEKAGFKQVGIRREYNKINGRFVDEVFFDIIKTDYLSSLKS